MWQSAKGNRLKNKSLYIIGIGPGNSALLAPQARHALENAETIAGYKLYLELIEEELLAGKPLIHTGMRQETERCRAAIASALSGSPTALVSSGDAGIYGMAGLIYELLPECDPEGQVHVEVIPGIPAVCAAAALLGAPLMHDFACVSLSDLLTPMDKIVARLHGAFGADFVVAIYNPRSRGRDGHLAMAMDIAKKYRASDCPVGLARNVSRAEQSYSICTLKNFNPEDADMLSIVLVGNTSTKLINGKMVTPRGYGL